jgi:hypothetical protein
MIDLGENGAATRVQNIGWTPSLSPLHRVPERR